MKTASNASIRRAITTLKKADVLSEFSNAHADNFVQNKMSAIITVDVHLLSPKKSLKKRLPKHKIVKPDINAATGYDSIEEIRAMQG